MLSLLVVFPSASLSGQAVAAGTVQRPTASDTVPVPGVRVVLHRVGRELQGPVDSVLSDGRGRFRFSFPADTSSLFLLSARYRGIEYFSSPVHTNPSRPDTALSLVVYDTSSMTPVSLSARHLVVPRPGDDGTREVLDLVVLANETRLARVAPDSLGASWRGPLPPGSEGLEVGESDVSPNAVSRRGDSVFLGAPIAPGEKQLAFQYHLPVGLREVEIPIGAEPVTINVLVEEPGARVLGAGLAPADSQVLEGRSFRRWTGAVPAGARLRLLLPAAGPGSGTLLAVLVAGTALALALATWRLVLRDAAPVPASVPPSPPWDPLLDAIAALDARYAGHESETDPAEWAEYREQRARLKAELEASLAGGKAAP